jgi:hypothetical protein
MAHFQLTDGTRLFVKGDSGEEKSAIHKGKQVTLEQWGGADASGKVMPALYSTDPAVGVLDFKVSGIKQRFVVKSIADGKATLNGKDAKGADSVWPLTVVAGEFKNHVGMAIDLLAEELGRSADPFKIYSLQRLLNNNDDNLFNQRSSANTDKFKTRLACGSVCTASGSKLFGKVSENYLTYHTLTTKVDSRDDVKYAKGTIDRARVVIKKLLEKGTAVRVGVTYAPSTAMIKARQLQPTSSGGHFVLIVGCNAAADQFLYIDPWPGGSKLQYKGGIASDPYPDKCKFLGLFVIENLARGPVLRQSKDAEGSFSGDSFLEIIAGP